MKSGNWLLQYEKVVSVVKSLTDMLACKWFIGHAKLGRCSLLSLNRSRLQQVPYFGFKLLKVKLLPN